MEKEAVAGGGAIKELSLFTGAGGGLLGTMLLGWRCVGAVEWEDYPCRVLEARQKDGILDEFPIWHMDIREFNQRIAPSYTGLVDVITAGFPCQPFSVAGKQMAADDNRNMWPATIECISVVRPRFCLLENVPNLITGGYFGTVLGDLAACGYGARWDVFSAAQFGAPIERARVFIACTDESNGEAWMGYKQNGAQTILKEETRKRNDVWLQAPSRSVGVGNGVADYMERVGAIGNSQVPRVVQAAWRLLTE